MMTSAIPEKVFRLYQQLHDDHRRTGEIPARLETAEDVWCHVKDAQPDHLREAMLYNDGAIKTKLARYAEKPDPELAEDIARHMFCVEVASTLLDKANAGDFPP